MFNSLILSIMKQSFLSVLLLAATITSCTNQDVVDTEYDKQVKGIQFNVYNGITRGTPITGNDAFLKSKSSFGVTAFISGGESPYMGSLTEGIQIKSDGANWGYADPGDQAFWPTKGETLNFYAYAPYGAIKPTFSSDKKLSFEYVVPKNEDQVDVMFASATRVSEASGNKAVPMLFSHALTQVRFAVATKTKSLKIDIAENGIQINNIKSTGTFTLPESENNGWSNLSAPTAYTVTNALVTGVYKGEPSKYTPVGTVDKALMLLPQTFAAKSEGAPEGAFLKITCKIYQVLEDGTPIYLKGGADTFATIEVPVSSLGIKDTSPVEVWNRGKKVTYNLLIGGGSSTGLEPIEFTAKAADWDPADGGEIENK